MDVGRQKHMRDDQTSNCWSYGSINHPASQSRKMSIGVVVDSIAKKKSKCAKEREFMGPNAEEGNANVSNTIQGKFNNEEVTPAKTTTETRTPEQVGSPWISTRPFQKDIPISDAVVHAKQASNISSSGKRQYKLDGARNTTLKYSLDFFTNKTSILQSGDNKHKKFSGVTEKKRELNDGNEEEVQDFTFANVQEVVMQDKEVLVDKTDAQENTRTGTLRMKLWNILGAAASPNDQHPKSQEPEVGRDNLIPQSEVDQMADLVNRTKNSDEPADKYMEKGDAFIKHRQNSDTIETDSESPNNTVRRPVTRSLIRKRAQAKVGRTTTKPAPSSGYKRKQRDNVYSFEQEFYEALQDSAGKSSKFQKKRENTGFRTETHEVCLPEKDNPTKIQQAIYRRGKRPSAKKACSGGTKMGDFQGCLPDGENEFPEQEKTVPEKEFDSSPLISKKFGDCDKSESKNHQQGSENPSSKNPVNSENNFVSPTFGIRGPVSISSPSSIPKSDQRADCSSPARMERRFDMGDIRGFRSFSTSKQDFSENGQTQSSDAAAEIRDSPLMKTAPEMEKNDAESGLSLSSSEERDLETFEEGSPVMRGHKWTVEDNCMEEPSDPNEVDGLARAVELFALGLEKLKTKMKTATTRKSSEILTSVAAEVQLRLQNVESQIQTDMGKLTNLSKSKRKKLETRFEEQQGQLKVICDKFKEQINQHLQDCKSTFEGLDVYQTEFKGTVEKQKASHRKLVSQVEEAIENQLNDAQKRIKVMNETRRGQMLQLKRQLASCLREGILS
ncbi:meiosis-specific protein ASY3 [Argentina anserina]|uniref:meiosis-specific protein ASY3 n=1 Tax=Argentina anserina TaxID=57926 RepID=UPI0021763915|nr:meiosis-specific protein ASY3 [Potentilla anserina]